MQFRPDAALPFAHTEDITRILRRHYLPLLTSNFLKLYARMGLYAESLRFVVNDHVVEPMDLTTEFGLANGKEFIPTAAGKRFGYSVLGVASHDYLGFRPRWCSRLYSRQGRQERVRGRESFSQGYVRSMVVGEASPGANEDAMADVAQLISILRASGAGMGGVLHCQDQAALTAAQAVTLI